MQRLLLFCLSISVIIACTGNLEPLNANDPTDPEDSADSGVAGGTGGGSGAGGAGGAGGSGNSGGGAGTGGGTPTTIPADGGLPCEVAELLSTHCIRCHGSPLTSSAPMPLLTRADLLATSPRNTALSQAERGLVRMRDNTSPMPPAPASRPSMASLDAFATWVAAGLPEGSCGSIDAGQPIDAGPPVLTCMSNVFQPRPVPADDHGSASMAPGLACISCHSGMNFMNQNPGGALGNSDELKQFMGTVFRSAHERDLCQPRLGITARVEILDPAGAVLATLPVNAGGNFLGDATPRPTSFRARVVTAQGTREMMTAQTVGDCNTCHTAEGRNGAPGRIFLP